MAFSRYHATSIRQRWYIVTFPAKTQHVKDSSVVIVTLIKMNVRIVYLDTHY
jgi:preprotein translocase subunit SecE